jgi:hypothetical protein
MKGVVYMTVYETSLAQPTAPVTIQASKPRFEAATRVAREVGGWNFEIKEVVQISIFVA